MTGVKTLAAQIEDGAAKADGNLDILNQLGSAIVASEIRFEILPGTRAPPEDDLNDFEVGPIQIQGE